MAGRSPQSRARSRLAHQQARRALILRTWPGSPCPRCQKPMTAPPGGRWGDGLDADHVSTLAALNPHALPDALSHSKCNRVHGGALTMRLRGVTNWAERERIVEEVTKEVHARLRGEYDARKETMGRRGKNGTRRRRYVPIDSPQPRRITDW